MVVVQTTRGRVALFSCGVVVFARDELVLDLEPSWALQPWRKKRPQQSAPHRQKREIEKAEKAGEEKTRLVELCVNMGFEDSFVTIFSQS
jgi:hypothetical protein